jgi:hypothetical protein
LVVYKYPLPEVDNVLELPVGARLLHVDAQHGAPMLWAMVEPGPDVEARRILIAGTGQPIDVEQEALTHISTFLVSGGIFVSHAFEVRSEGGE